MFIQSYIAVCSSIIYLSTTNFLVLKKYIKLYFDSKKTKLKIERKNYLTYTTKEKLYINGNKIRRLQHRIT